jgi:hypothetical protein
MGENIYYFRNIQSIMGKKLTIEEMKQIAQDRGGECLSDEYVNTMTNLKWRCKDGHVWEARPLNIKRGKDGHVWEARPLNIKRGGWCPYCSHRVKLTLAEMKELAKSKGGECLSDVYVNTNTKLKWRFAHIGLN